MKCQYTTIGICQDVSISKKRHIQGSATSWAWRSPWVGALKDVAVPKAWQSQRSSNIHVMAASMWWRSPTIGDLQQVATSSALVSNESQSPSTCNLREVTISIIWQCPTRGNTHELAISKVWQYHGRGTIQCVAISNKWQSQIKCHHQEMTTSNVGAFAIHRSPSIICNSNDVAIYNRFVAAGCVLNACVACHSY